MERGSDGRTRRAPAPPGPPSQADRQQQTDRGHDNDQRGEHRYPDSHQSESEQAARQDRDDLKERLRRQSHQSTART